MAATNSRGEQKKTGSTVSLVHASGSVREVKDSVSKALSLIDFNLENPPESVVIKVNLCYYWQPATGYTTDPKVVAAIIDHIRDSYGKEMSISIAEADATAMRTRHAFPMLGYEKLAKEKDVELLNLSTDSIEKRTVQVNGHAISFDVPKSLLTSDLFVNVPKLKAMRATRITCALKNIFGCIAAPRKIQYHSLLDEAIVGINKILRPHLTIVDGLTASGGHPIKLDLIMAGTDPFSIDWVASQIMGYNPSRIRFLKLAMKEKVGASEGIVTAGENLVRFKKLFPKPGFLSSDRAWSIQIGLLRLYNRIANDIIPPILEEG